jgi:hypothetical protein
LSDPHAFGAPSRLKTAFNSNFLAGEKDAEVKKEENTGKGDGNVLTGSDTSMKQLQHALFDIA